MTEESQPQLSPKDEQELEEFLSDFAVYKEAEDPPEGEDYLDIGVPTAVENVQAAQASAEAAAESVAEEVEGEQEEDALGAAMTQDQLDALFAGDVVAAFAGGDESEETAEDALAAALEAPAEAEEAEATVEEEPAQEEPAQEEPAEEAAEAGDSLLLSDEDLFETAEAGGIGMPDADQLDVAEEIETAEITDEPVPEVEEEDPLAALEMAPEPATEEADEGAGALELSDDDLASLLAGDDEASEPQDSPAVAASVPDLSQDEIDSLFGAPASDPEVEVVEESAELSQADIDALLAGSASTEEDEFAVTDEGIPQLEITDEELMMLEQDPVEEGATEALDLDALAALADDDGPTEEPAADVSDDEPDPVAAAAAAVAMEVEVEVEVEVDDEGAATLDITEDGAGPRQIFGLPMRLLAAVAAVPLVLIAALAFTVLGGGEDSPAEEVVAETPAEEVPADEAHPPEAEAVPADADHEAAETVEPAVEPAADEHEATEPEVESEVVEEPTVVPEPEETPAAERTPPPEPPPLEPAPPPPAGIIGPSTEVAEVVFPRFSFNDPAGDGINPLSGEPRLNIVPAADILELSVATTDLQGGTAGGGELTDDGFAGPSAGLEVTVRLGAAPGELARGTFELRLSGRFASATAADLAPTGVTGMPEGSQLSFNIWKQGGAWQGEQIAWNPALKAAVRVGQFTNFSVQQNRISLAIPSPLLFMSMPDGVERDDFQFYVRVEHITDTIAISDYVGSDVPLEALDPLLVDLTGRIAAGQPTHTPEYEDTLSEMQTRVLLHNERRARGLLSVVDPAFRLAQPVARR